MKGGREEIKRKHARIEATVDNFQRDVSTFHILLWGEGVIWRTIDE